MIYIKTLLNEKTKEALQSVLPICIIVYVLCFSFSSIPNSILMSFTIGSILLIAGMGFFTLGADTSMTLIGEALGSHLTKTKNIFLIVIITFIVGVTITISEPDLQVLANQVPTIPNAILIATVSIGVGFFLVVAVLRIFLKIPLSYILIFFYGIVFLLAQFVDPQFLAVAFDSGGVTTGPMTVPFIMAFGIGISSIRTDKDTSNDTFGLVALGSIGPILSVLILGMIYQPKGSSYALTIVPDATDTKSLWMMFLNASPHYLLEVGLALCPILLFFILFQWKFLRLPFRKFMSILSGIVYTCIGLTLFLIGANIGFIPAGRYLGSTIASLDYNYILIPIGMLLGYMNVAAEPSVHVLNKQVEELTSGLIPVRYMKRSLSIGVAISVGLAMLRIITNINIMWILCIGYGIAILLSFFVSPIFTAIAFDSGGVASGPMTATFLLAFSIGSCEALGGNIVINAFGLVALVAMTPLITIQILGIVYKIKYHGLPTTNTDEINVTDDDIIDL